MPSLTDAALREPGAFGLFFEGTVREGHNGVVLDVYDPLFFVRPERDKALPQLAVLDFRHFHRPAGSSDVKGEAMAGCDLVSGVGSGDAFGVFEHFDQSIAFHGPDGPGLERRRQGRVLSPALAVAIAAVTLSAAGCVPRDVARGRHAMDAGRFEQAATHFRRAAENDPQEPARWMAVARAELLAERPARAREAFQHVAALRPNDPRPWIEIGYTHELERHFDRAAVSYQRAINVMPKAAFPRRVLGTRLLRWGDAARAARVLDRAVRLEPDHAETWNALGHAYVQSERPDLALRTFQLGARRHPQHIGLKLGWAAALINRRSYPEALAVYDEVVKLAPRFAPAHAGRGILLHELRREEEAEAAFVRAAEVAQRPKPYRRRLTEYRALRKRGHRTNESRRRPED